MKQIIIILFSTITFTAFAQIKEVNTEEFPKVSLIWNSYGNANLKNFTITENGTEVKIEDSRIEQVKLTDTAKSVVVLWEDNGSLEQFQCSQNILNKLFSDDEDTETKYCVMVFSSVQGKKVSPLTDNFVSKNAALNEVNSYERLKNVNSNDMISLTLPMNRALDLLRDENNNTAKAIFILTGGYIYLDASYAAELSELRIPVYIIELQSSRKNENLKESVEKTVEDIIPANVNNRESWTSAEKQMKTVIDNLNAHHYGYDYKITFLSNQKRNKKMCDLKLVVQGKSYERRYKTPGFSTKVFIRDNTVIAAIILMVAVAVIIVSSVLGYNAWQRKKTRDVEAKAAKEKREQELAWQAQVNREEIRRLEDERRREKSGWEREKANATNAEQEANLLRLMQNKQLFPTLNIMGNQIYEIKSPVTTIGRNNNNDIVLPYNSVSGQHALIIFNGAEFEIFDTSKNGTFVNDVKVIEKQELNRGDKIQLTDFEKIIIRFEL